MKKFILPLSAFVVAALFSGCAVPQPHGFIYSDYKVADKTSIVYPNSTGIDVSKLKSGTSIANGFLGNLVAIGDASISTAAKNGGIKTVHYVDWKVKSVIGIVEEYECIVWGE